VREEASAGVPIDSELQSRMEKEVAIAHEGNAFQKGFMNLGELSPFTCPECHGALVRVVEGRMARFRCHTGHAYSDNALLESVMRHTGEQLWQVMRSLEEGVMLLKEMGQSLEDKGDKERAALFRKKGHELEKRSRTFHDEVLKHESLSGDNLGMTLPHA
jgi:two-component system chemotaxis response regulator CheB